MKTKSPEYPDPMCEFLHHLHDTVILLGGDEKLAKLVESAQDGVTDSKVNALRNFNIALFTKAKSVLTQLHRVKLRVSIIPPPEAA